MKLSAYKALATENARTATLFDLTERFPRGPKAKLRRKDYTTDGWSEPVSEKLIGGDYGYDMFELYKLCSEGWHTGKLDDMTTKIEDASMGGEEFNWDYDKGERIGTGDFKIFKNGPQTTRRVRRLENRLRAVRKLVEQRSKKNLYNITAGQWRVPVAVFGDSDVHALQQFNLLVKGAFDAGLESGLMQNGWRSDSKEVTPEASFRGPSHGPHEIMAKNEEFVKSIRTKQAECKATIKKMQDQIQAADDIAAMVEMFTLNTCAQQFGDTE
jgi:hypothetical protein